jgi:hypothetical protein
MSEDKNNADQKNTEPVTEKKPNENAGFYFSSSLKITDPGTGQVLLQMRCD